MVRPCLAELPEFVTMNRMYRGREFELVTISLDELDLEPQAARGAEGQESGGEELSVGHCRSRPPGRPARQGWAGPLPHTVLIAPGGQVIYRHTGSVDPLAVRRAIADFLGRTYASREPAKK